MLFLYFLNKGLYYQRKCLVWCKYWKILWSVINYDANGLKILNVNKISIIEQDIARVRFG